jgi:uncharacterized protein YjiK
LKRFCAILGLIACGCGVAGDSGRLARYALSNDSMQQWKLPSALREISGLAMSADDRLFAVTDEVAVVFEINYTDGALIKAFAFDDPPIRGDFEGIAWLDGRVYLTTSDGVLYSAAEGADGEHVDAERLDTGLGKACEIEGLAGERKPGLLFFACKQARKGREPSDAAIYAWSMGDRRIIRRIDLPFADIERALGADHFNPSGLVIDGESGHFLIVAARQHSLIELDQAGQLVAAHRFRHSRRHRQSEGIELTSDGRLLISDEGGDKRARLAVYEPGEREGSK